MGGGLYCLPCLLFCLRGVLAVFPAVHGPLGTRAPPPTPWLSDAVAARLYFMSPKKKVEAYTEVCRQ